MKTKQIIACITAMCICFSLASCTAQNNDFAEVEKSTTTTVNTKPSESITTEDTVSVEKSSTKVNKSTVNKTTSEKKAENNTTANSTAKKDKTTVSSSKQNTTTEKTTKSGTSKSDNNTTTTKQTTTQADCCYLTIECTAILSNMDKLKSGHSSFLGDNGYILNHYAVRYEIGDTAYDILKKGCQQNSIKLTTESSVYGIYVVGINNLDQFDCGNQSGWLYYVNGTSPPKSADKFDVNINDTITFSYTC